MPINSCGVCPRRCAQKGTAPFCGKGTDGILIARAGLHFFEEPVISGQNGSGTVFFGGCNLKCGYCQNYEISFGRKYCKTVSPRGLAEFFKSLEQQGAHNVNLVTPSHYVPQIIEALNIYRRRRPVRPKIPVVYNTSSYDSVEAIESLREYVDIYLADLKYYDPVLSEKYSRCPDYFTVASAAIKRMSKHIPENIIENGIMKKGLIIRHLILPSHTDDSIKVLDWIAGNVKGAGVSLMRQYTPHGRAYEHPEINRPLTAYEYNKAVKYALKLGLDGYVQDRGAVGKKYIPEWGEF